MKTIIFGVLALFFGIYAMVLELKGIANLDKLVASAVLIALVVTSGDHRPYGR